MPTSPRLRNLAPGAVFLALVLPGCDESPYVEDEFHAAPIHLAGEVTSTTSILTACLDGYFLGDVASADLLFGATAAGRGGTLELDVAVQNLLPETASVPVGAEIEVSMSAHPGLGLESLCNDGVEVTVSSASGDALEVEWAARFRFNGKSDEITTAAIRFEAVAPE